MWQEKELKKPFNEGNGNVTHIGPGDSIDLHTFHPRDIPSVVEEFLKISKEAGFKEIRIIHGKGKGVQRNIVRNLLKKLPYVENFYDAPPERGHYGATIVILKDEK